MVEKKNDKEKKHVEMAFIKFKVTKHTFQFYNIILGKQTEKKRDGKGGKMLEKKERQIVKEKKAKTNEKED